MHFLPPSEPPKPSENGPYEEMHFRETVECISSKVPSNLNEETTTDSSRPREAPDLAVGSSSSSEVREEGDGEAPMADVVSVETPVMAAPVEPAPVIVDPAPVEPAPVIVDPARAALDARIEAIAPGDENCEVRRALEDASHDMLKTAKLGGSSSPIDHVRMAIDKAATNPKRRDTIESLARGILRNWVKEGFPAVIAPDAPACRQPAPDLEALRGAAIEKRRADDQAEANELALKARWDSLPQATKDAKEAEFERADPQPSSDRVLIRVWTLRLRKTCLEWLASQP